MSSDSDSNLHCSFCGKNTKEVKKLIQGPDVYICDGCIELCHSLIKGGTLAESPAKTDGELVVSETDENAPIPTPRQIKAHLDQFVIGQEDAKMSIAVAVYNHYQRLENPVVGEIEIEKSNIMLLGPTGSGKTLIAQSIAKMLDVPLVVTDATSLTEAGYVGDDVESIIVRLISAANGNVKQAERGIVFIDEIDKKRASQGGAQRDVSGEGAQQGLLKLLEGSEVLVPANGKRTPGSDMVKVNTRNILFICGGAFVGLEKIIEKTLDGQDTRSGFTSTKVGKQDVSADAILKKVSPEHLIKYGMIAELVGRLPVHVVLEELTEEQLVRVLTEPKNAITKQFTARFSLDEVELEFTHEALLSIAQTAKARKTGARGLRGTIENALMRIQFDLPELAQRGVYKIIIGKGVIEGTEKPELVYTGTVLEEEMKSLPKPE